MINTIHKTFSNKVDSVEINFTLEQLELSVNKAVTCGLPINELVVNAFKHAFDQTDHEVLEVKLYQSKDQSVLTIRDNSPGLPDNYSANSESLGSMLVETLTAQLETEMEIFSSETGSAFTFIIPMK